MAANLHERITKMLCCCDDNVEACFVKGIILVTWNLLHCVGAWHGWFKKWLYGDGEGEKILFIFGEFGIPALVSGILIFGAKKRNPTAILVWIVLEIIGVVYAIAFALLSIIRYSLMLKNGANTTQGELGQQQVNGTSDPDDDAGHDMTIFIIGNISIWAKILLQIWTIIAAKIARKEICNNSPSIAPVFSKVEDSFVNGIVMAVLYFWSCFGGTGIAWLSILYRILIGIFGVLMSGILIFGAKKRNRTAILVGIIFAIIGVKVLTAFAVFAINLICESFSPDPDDAIPDPDDAMTPLAQLVVWFVLHFSILSVIRIGPLILFQIWTIIVAKRARKEICNNDPCSGLVLQNQLSVTSTTPVLNKVEDEDEDEDC